MGERKGQNFYYPPDFDYKKHNSLNHYHGTHALRERAKKIGQGILVIRFELPFNIWCLGCNNHVGMGVRYNAEKKKIGMYYTTPLYEFRMKCHLCDNYYVIRTDPKNLDYELVEGCKRQEKRWEPTENGQLPGYERTKAGSAMSQKMAADAMFKAEHGEKDKTKAETGERDIDTLEWLQDRMRDDFSANQALRAQFRKEKRDLTERRAVDDALKAKGSLSIELAPELPDDRRVAGVVMKMAKVKTWEERQEEARHSVSTRRIFDGSGPSTSSQSEYSSNAEKLRSSVRQLKNKRINDQFEFGHSSTEKKQKSSIGIVRKVKGNCTQLEKNEDEGNEEKPMTNEEIQGEIVKKESEELKPDPLRSLVDYGSGSDSGSD